MFVSVIDLMEVVGILLHFHTWVSELIFSSNEIDLLAWSWPCNSRPGLYVINTYLLYMGFESSKEREIRE